MTSEELINKYIGRPFVEDSFDCFDLVVLWFKDLGHEIPDYRHARYWEGEPMDLEQYFKLWRKIEQDEKVQSNDVVFTTDGDRIHIGIVIEKGTYIHCMRREGVVRTQIKRHSRLIKGFYRLRALENG